jgi:hypothetical protein
MSNSLSSVIPQILIRTLPVLRQNACLPQLSDTSYGEDAQEQGNQITIGKTVAATARDVVASVVAATNQDITPTNVVVSLSNWKESTTPITDKEIREIAKGFLPKQFGENVKAVVNAVEQSFLDAALLGGNAVGTAGTTPFNGSMVVAGSARKVLNIGLAPMDERYVVLDPSAENNALLAPETFRYDGAGDQLTQINGSMGTRLGMRWFMDQNISTHTVGTAWTTGYSVLTAGAAAGAVLMSVINATGTGTILVGDKFTVAGSSQVYAITSIVAHASNAADTISFAPALVTAAVSGGALTVFASFVQNLCFQRGAFAFASRPLAPAMGSTADDMSSIVDEISGLALTVAITRESYQSTFRVSCLWGVKLVRPEFCTHILG